jgi:hypothetical protein
MFEQLNRWVFQDRNIKENLVYLLMSKDVEE